MKAKALEYVVRLLVHVARCENVESTLGPQMAAAAVIDCFRAVGLLSVEDAADLEERLIDAVDELRRKCGQKVPTRERKPRPAAPPEPTPPWTKLHEALASAYVAGWYAGGEKKNDSGKVEVAREWADKLGLAELVNVLKETKGMIGTGEMVVDSASADVSRCELAERIDELLKDWSF